MAKIWLAILVLLVQPVCAVIESYEFESDVDQARYQNFVDELRCPKCQNQNLSGSNSPIAADLRRELHRLIDEGKSDAEITNFMLNRYGDFILYRPRMTAATAALWFGPFVFLGIGGFVWWRMARNSKTPTKIHSPELSEEEKRILDNVLGEPANEPR